MSRASVSRSPWRCKIVIQDARTSFGVRFGVGCNRYICVLVKLIFVFHLFSWRCRTKPAESFGHVQCHSSSRLKYIDGFPTHFGEIGRYLSYLPAGWDTYMFDRQKDDTRRVNQPINRRFVACFQRRMVPLRLISFGAILYWTSSGHFDRRIHIVSFKAPETGQKMFMGHDACQPR